jgi:hypothetical protein
MLTGSIRVCDLCCAAIPEGDKYRVMVIPEKEAQSFRAEMESEADPDLVPTTTVDAQGNIRMDICSVCLLYIGEQNTESAN